MKELIRQARAGNAEAKEELLKLLRPRLRKWVEQALRARFAGKIDASDITQETLLDVAQKIGQFLGSTEEEFLDWAKEGLRRDVIDAIRRATAQRRSVDRERSLDDAHGEGTPLRDHLDADPSTPSRQAMRNEDAKLLYAALKDLPDDQAKAIRLVHIEGQSLARAAIELQRSPDAVAKLLQRGMASLKKRMPRRS